MKLILCLITALACAFAEMTPAATRQVMKGSDVVFMYTADKEYLDQYGATWIAWGGGGRIAGVHTTGSFWCLTAGPRLLHDDPALHEAVCRDIDGKPISPSWQLDNTYKGQPTWFGCTNNPAFRKHLREECLKAVSERPDGLHIDDPAGSFGSTSAGGCYCDSCMKAFREYLVAHDSPSLREEAGVSSWDGFDYRRLIRSHTPTRKLYTNPESLPLRRAYLDFQVEAMVEGIRELGALARSKLGPEMTLSVNTYYGSPASPNIAFVPVITHMVCEVEHHASEGTTRLMTPVGAYRQAETLGRPLAATASGSDWAWVKEHNAVNLAKVWIALSYACGQRLMVPHPTMQWCHTAEKGTHWYKAPPAEFAALYRPPRSRRPSPGNRTATRSGRPCPGATRVRFRQGKDCGCSRARSRPGKWWYTWSIRATMRLRTCSYRTRMWRLACLHQSSREPSGRPCSVATTPPRLSFARRSVPAD
jgi:hypothetical protein